ncbi:MAG: hypothetical protein RL514_687 [Verrucomicrobiota bacterium]|jgi:DNA repair exonuclease SbcCD ATPase subunit
MKRILLFTALAGWLALPAARAQNLVGDAVRQELEDRLRRVERDLEAVKEANDLLRKRLAELQRNASLVEDAAAKAATKTSNILQTTASKEELHQLRDALKESERRRSEDQKKLTDMLERLQRELSAAPPAVASPVRPPKANPPPEKPKSSSTGVSDTGVYHVVEKNQTVSEIIKAYNDDQKAKGRPSKLTLQQLAAANPNADMNKVRAGQKLFIPLAEK